MNHSSVITYGLEDTALSNALCGKPDLVLIKRAFRFLLAVPNSGHYTVLSGELGKQTFKALKYAARQGALAVANWPDSLSDRPQSLPWSTLSGAKTASVADVESWQIHREKLMVAGRGPNMPSHAKTEVLRDAAGVCMFHGCGKRVDGIGGSPRLGNVGQLAHIVGADPGGPRGTDESHALADKASNLMLVCYDHHRLVDVIDPERYTITELQEMRRQHVSKVSDLLRQLAWPRAKPLIIRGGIAGQLPAVTSREIHDSLEDIKMTAGDSDGEFLHTSPIERTTANYGSTVLSQLKPSIARLSNVLQGGHYGPSNDDIAVYAIHDTPVLVLAGRVVGEGRTTHVFQRDRDNKSWRWREPLAKMPQLVIDTNCRAAPQSRVSQGVLTIALSDKFQDAWLSPDLHSMIKKSEAVWLSIDARNPSHSVIQSPADHRHVMLSVREAFRRLQGDYQVQEIALIIVAPASIAFSIGQALQAGHHLPVVVFNRLDFTVPFQPVFRITGRTVESADSGQQQTVIISLQ